MPLKCEYRRKIDGAERSDRRNPQIAQTLYYSKDVERFGTGLRRISDACKAAGVRVEFQILKSGFVVVFYRPDEHDSFVDPATTEIHALRDESNGYWYGRKPELSGDKLELSGDKSDLSGSKPKLSGSKPELSGSKPELSGSKPELSGSKLELSGDKPELSGDKPELSGDKPELSDSKSNGKPRKKSAETRDNIIEFVKLNGQINCDQARTLLDLAVTRTNTIFKQMVTAGLIEAHGTFRDRHYTLKK